ncbi:hypothetical protein DUT91_23805 [Phyllobacterium salinisoli]|uniref:Uncharacterized protein n=1 Tax=Phyllobacterium salinisoli TaxID=1899321 RepID=A0A368JX61_9HYPH|nr:RuvA C-terminal domain-containing protein [Phyllobacterium salinisoli]RCS21474.1 hypothetical protein DUT91_23805 [Phyllobacterium salinisoli]
MTPRYKQIFDIVDQLSSNLHCPVGFSKNRSDIVKDTHRQFLMALIALGFTEEEIEAATGGLFKLVERRLCAIYRCSRAIFKSGQPC